MTRDCTMNNTVRMYIPKMHLVAMKESKKVLHLQPWCHSTLL